MILIDSNVFLDIFSNDPNWLEWSVSKMAEVTDRSDACINPVIYAEISIRFTSIEELDEVLPVDVFRRESIPYQAAYLAGKAHAAYRRRGGSRTATLPDFFIGAHAAVSNYTILTRDPRRIRRYFPSVKLIAP
jgi:predicted nucleic acid-binding protein